MSSLDELVREKVRQKAWDYINSRDMETPDDEAVERETNRRMSRLAELIADLLDKE